MKKALIISCILLIPFGHITALYGASIGGISSVLVLVGGGLSGAGIGILWRGESNDPPRGKKAKVPKAVKATVAIDCPN